MSLKEQLGKRIKLVRKSKNYTQEKLSELIGIEIKSLSKIENGWNYPGGETLSAIIDALQIAPYELFVFDDEPDYEGMKKEIIEALEDNKTVLMLYKKLKGIN